MGETEKVKTTKTKSSSSLIIHKTMSVLTSTTIRGIVSTANEVGISREDIVSLLKENGQFVLVYFK